MQGLKDLTYSYIILIYNLYDYDLSKKKRFFAHSQKVSIISLEVEGNPAPANV